MQRIDRRQALKLVGSVGGALALGFSIENSAAVVKADPTEPNFAPNPFIVIATNDDVLLYAKSPEMGQGIKTAFPMIIAEELDVDWARVRVEQSPIDASRFGTQIAGGSRSVATNWNLLRQVGASARAMLVSAAAKQWAVRVEECSTHSGVVHHEPSGRKARYGELTVLAAREPVPPVESLQLKKRDSYRLLGRRVPGVDNPKIVAGQQAFGIDTVLPGMLFATYKKAPSIGARVRGVNIDAVKKLPGVKHVFVVQGNGNPRELVTGVAVLATSTWAALKAGDAMEIDWDESDGSKDSWADIQKKAASIERSSPQQVLRETGSHEEHFAGDAQTIETFYQYPFLAHGTLEPQNCSAWYRDGKVELWAPTQVPERGITAVASVLGVAPTQITINQTRIGGGFGRRLVAEYMAEVAIISRDAGGVPVKLVYSRADDIAHDFLRPAGFHALRGAVTEEGKLSAWQGHFISFSADGKTPVAGGTMVATEFPGPLVEHYRLGQTLLPLSTRCGAWRSPGHCGIAFAIQGFIHELATLAKRDHLEFLLEILGEPRWLEPADDRALHTGRAAGVIRLAAEKAGWGRKLPAGRGLGLAFHFSHAGHVAEVAEVSVGAQRKVTLHRVTVAADIGPIVNLSGAEAQMQGAVVDGYSAMAMQEVMLENGRIVQSNFHDYPLLRIDQAPSVDVHFIQSDFPPTGAGEPALPPLAPAVCNAIFAAIGERVRTLPLSRSNLTV